MIHPPQPPLVVILGPTAVGKTEISLQLAERLKGEIVSADSRLLYRGMDIGTAKPSRAEFQRVPHHLIDVADPDETWSLALFQEEAHRIIAEIHQRLRLPFLVGGTGQYIRAVIEEWEIPRVEPDPRLRQALEKWAEVIGLQGLHDRLAVLDPQAAQGIDFRNLRRTVRALEVILLTGQPFSTQRKRGTSPYDTLLVGLNRPRPDLYARVDARIDQMIEMGLEEEVKKLLDKGYSPDLPTLSAIGYREITAAIREEMSLEEALTQIKRITRIFVRRQANWFKASDPDIHWFDAASQGVVEEIETLIRIWLSDRQA
jgi:tRNA dimethylallyltransferase